MSLKSKLKHFLAALGVAFFTLTLQRVTAVQINQNIKANTENMATVTKLFSSHKSAVTITALSFLIGLIVHKFNQPGLVAFMLTRTSTVSSRDGGKQIRC